ncbi:MAG TPA: DUF3108 domain-containing protein [Mariprofundaceae bacterium]|nr:DUF3108 domain-containing protein [Mariprofundaceae bacterium]
MRRATNGERGARRLFPALVAGLLLVAGQCAPAVAASAVSGCLPFVGERMQFSVGWEFIDAGLATMHVKASGADGYRIDTFARTNAFFDLFKKVRDTITSEGVCRGKRMQSTLFEIEQNEHTYHSKKSIRFLWRENRVSYTQSGKTDIYEVKSGHLNAIDAFLAVRSMPLKVGDIVRVPVFDSRKKYLVEVHVLKKVRMSAPWGKSVESIIIEPKLKTETIFSSKGKVMIWLTNDARHVPLRMTAKIRFGRIVARLIDYSKVP